MESLMQSVNQMNELFNKKMSEFQQELQSTHASSTTSTLASEFSAFKSFVLEALKSLQTQIEALMDVQDQVEMRRRRKILLVHGVPEDKKVVSEVISSLISSQLQIPDVDMSDIKHCHRLGRLSESKPRPILVKFNDLAIRNKVWMAKTKLKNSGITLSEFLIKKRHSIFMAARQRFGVSKCWTYNGSVIVMGPDGSKVRALSMADLDAIPGPTSTDIQIESDGRTVPVTRGKTTAGIKTKKLAKK